jgi:hypothetical protein
MAPLRTYFSDEACCIAFWNNVVLIDVDGEMSAMRLRKVGDCYRELLSLYPRIAAICVMRPGTPVSGSEARAEGARFMKEFGVSVAHVAMVIEAQGIIAQMLRSVIRGINTITRNTNMSVAADVEEGIRAVVPTIISTSARTQLVPELRSALNTMRNGFRPAHSQLDGVG